MSGEIAKLRPGTAVVGRDGRLGTLRALVVDPDSLELTHLAVSEDDVPGSERLVATSDIQSASEGEVSLDVDRSQLAGSEPLYVPGQMEFMDGLEHVPLMLGTYKGPHPDTMFTFATEERTPEEGEAVLAHGDEVETSDGHRAGRVDELLIDPETSKVTAIELREGHILGRRQVVVPSNLIDKVQGHRVTLTIDRARLRKLE